MDYTLKDYTPISLTFGHGNLLPENAHQIHCEMFSEVKCPQKVAKVVLTDDSKNNTYLGSADNSNLCDNFIAIRNKATNSVRFYKMNNFFMSPYHKRDASQVEFKLGSRITDESWNDLNKFMGSKKIKSRQMAAERNSANLSDLNKTVTEAAGNNQSTTESPVSSSPGPGIDYLPPCDRSTNDITQAYKMNDLVSPDILDSLHSIAEEVLNMDLILLASDSRFSTFIMKAVSHFPKNRRSYKVMIFVDRLLAFNKVPPRLLSDRSQSFCSFSQDVHEKLIEDFSIPGLGNKRLRTPTMRDKILCYAMILIMMCCNYEIDIGMLADIVSPVEHKRLPLLLRAVGAKSGRAAPSIFKLKAPIGDPPVVKNRRNSKKLY